MSFKKRACLSIFKDYPKISKISFSLSDWNFVHSIIFTDGIDFKNTMLQEKPRVLEIGYGAGNYLIDLKTLGWEMSVWMSNGQASALTKLGIKLLPI